MAGKATGTVKGGKGKGKGKGNNVKYGSAVAVVLKRDCAEALYAALVVALGTVPSPKKKKKGAKGKGKGKGGKTPTKGKGGKKS